MPLIREMYHTQEKWKTKLTAAIPTTKSIAWLGEAAYFWYYEDDAVWWGTTSKQGTGYYEVYKATINSDNILDTVFNEEHYKLWVHNIERAIQKFYKSSGKVLTLKYINDFFKEKGIFDGIDGVLFQDITNNPKYWIIDKFQYKKRIQIAVYESAIISNFAFVFEGKCV